MLKMAATLGGRAVGISSFSCSCSSPKSCLSRQWNPRNPISNLPMETKEVKAAPEEAATPKEASALKPKPAAKVPTKPLPQLMEEEIIPRILEILQVRKDISGIGLSFQDNRLEGSFLKEGNKYSFWAFFSNGDLTGPKGFSLSSYGSDTSTVEPFLVDEKRPTTKLIVFWVEKRLATQGIITVWDE